jgi:hypothetical protein
MAAIPLLSGVAGSETGEFKQTYPLNLEPVIIDSKISKGQLKAAQGVVQLGTGPGPDRGGILWNGLMYRVMGSKLCSIAADGVEAQIGDVGAGARCAFDYSFDRLAVASAGGLWYYTTEGGLVQVTDEDLGTVTDMIWIDGYFMTTDGTYVVVTELSDPMQVKPLKYGSAEEDPDPITGLIKYRDEAYVIGRFTIQPFQNVGGNGFPFATDLRETIPFGCVGSAAKCLFSDGFAFIGSGRNQGLNVYMAGFQASAQAIGSRELCDALDALSDPTVVEIEQRADRAENRLFVHLPKETWVFLLNASTQAGEPIWYRLQTDASGYRCRNEIPAYGKKIVGDTQSGIFGYLTNETVLQYGITPSWQFDCGLLYNQGVGAILHSIELVGLPGRGANGAVFMSMTSDGEIWSVERSVKLIAANRNRRIAWRPHSRIGNYLGLRFRGTGTSLPGIASCEAKLAPLTS